MTEFSWDVRVSIADGQRATVYSRQQKFEVGAPVQFDVEYEHITALEYVLGAVGADIVNGLKSLGRRRRVEIDNVEALVSARLNNPLVHLGVLGEEGHAGIEKLTVKVYISSIEPEQDVQRIWDEMLERSPLVQTFINSIDLQLEMQVVI